MKQLNLLHPTVSRVKTFKRTAKNVAAMKACYRACHKSGIISDELMAKVEGTDYATR